MNMTSIHYNATVKHHCVAQLSRGEGVGEKRNCGEGGGRMEKREVEVE